MQVGDTVVHAQSIGIIVGVSTSDNPVVEWADNDAFEEVIAEDLIIISLPTPTVELDPSKEETNDSAE